MFLKIQTSLYLLDALNKCALKEKSHYNSKLYSLQRPSEMEARKARHGNLHFSKMIIRFYEHY